MSNEIKEGSFKAAEVVELTKQSLNFLAALVAPTVFQFPFPPILLAVWDWLTTNSHARREFPQLALGLPRGFAKSFLIKLFVVYCILFTHRKFILILASNENKAINILSDICDMLSEPNVRKVFGDWRLSKEVDRQELKKFTFRGRSIILLAMGINGDPRGINIKNERPDVMIFDDVQTREDSESLELSNKLESKLVGTIMKAKSPSGCMFLFVANMYPTKGSLLRRFKTNPNWVKFITGGILADGTSLWEDLHPIRQLLREYENDKAAGRADIFAAEVLNDENASSNQLINISDLPQCPYSIHDPAAGKFIVIDPATDKANADAVSIGLFAVYDSRPVLVKVTEGRFSPGETIHETLKLCLTHGCYLVVIEGVAYQSSLGYWFKYICNQQQIQGIKAVEIYPGHKSKNVRIMNMFKQLRAGELFYTPETAPNVNSQITQFNPLRADNVDGILDLLTYAPRVVELFQYDLLATISLEEQEYGAIEQYDIVANSPI